MNEDKRREKFNLRYSMYTDNYHEQVIEKLGQIYKSFIQLKLDVQINDNNNIYKQIVNAISNVYSFGVNRVFGEPSVQELYATLRVDNVMTQANKYMNAFNDVLLQVSWDYDKDMPVLMLRLPHTTEVDYINGKVHGVRYLVDVDCDSDSETWAYWSAHQHYYIKRRSDKEDKQALRVDVEGNEDFSNPLGVLPFVFMHNGWRDESFWDIYTGDDLTGGTLSLSIHLTFLNHLIKTQSFKQLVANGDNLKELSGQILDPLSVLTLSGQNTEIDVLDLQSNYDMLNKVSQDLANNIAINYGISPSQFRMTSQSSSGFALQMENLKLDRFTVEQQQDFAVYEKELFNLLLVVSEYYDKPLASDKMAIDFVEPNYPSSAQDRIAIDKNKIELGLTAPYLILMRDNPDLLEAEAKELVKQNIIARDEMNTPTSSPIIQGA